MAGSVGTPKAAAGKKRSADGTVKEEASTAVDAKAVASVNVEIKEDDGSDAESTTANVGSDPIDPNLTDSEGETEKET